MIESILKILEILLLALVGPWIILRVTKKNEEKRFEKSRRLEVFRNLLRRPINSVDDLTEEFVGLLNLVYIDFSGCNKVIEARKKFQELVTRGVAGDQRIFDQEFQRQRTELLKSMAAELGIIVSDDDLVHGQYYPEHFNNLSMQRKQLDNALLAVLNGQKSISVITSNYSPQNTLQQLDDLCDGEREVIRDMVSKNSNVHCTSTPNQHLSTLVNREILDFHPSQPPSSYTLYKMKDLVWEHVKNDQRFNT